MAGGAARHGVGDLARSSGLLGRGLAGSEVIGLAGRELRGGGISARGDAARQGPASRRDGECGYSLRHPSHWPATPGSRQLRQEGDRLRRDAKETATEWLLASVSFDDLSDVVSDRVAADSRAAISEMELWRRRMASGSGVRLFMASREAVGACGGNGGRIALPEPMPPAGGSAPAASRMLCCGERAPRRSCTIPAAAKGSACKGLQHMKWL